MKINSAAVFVLLLFLTVSVSAQKPEPAKPEAAKPSAAKLPAAKEILDRYVKALGGREAIEKIKSRVASGTLELTPMNLKGTFEAYAAPDAKSYTKMTIAGIGDLIEGTDGKTGWSINPMQGSRDRAGAELSQAKLNNDFYRDIRLDKLFSSIEVKGIEKVGDKDAYVVTGTAEGLPSETWYFDTKSGLMLRADMTAIAPEGNQPLTVFYEDMKAVDGVLVPFRLRTQTPGFTIVLVSTEIKHNVAIDDAKFAKPKQ